MDLSLIFFVMPSIKFPMHIPVKRRCEPTAKRPRPGPFKEMFSAKKERLEWVETKQESHG